MFGGRQLFPVMGLKISSGDPDRQHVNMSWSTNNNFPADGAKLTHVQTLLISWGSGDFPAPKLNEAESGTEVDLNFALTCVLARWTPVAVTAVWTPCRITGFSWESEKENEKRGIENLDSFRKGNSWKGDVGYIQPLFLPCSLPFNIQNTDKKRFLGSLEIWNSLHDIYSDHKDGETYRQMMMLSCWLPASWLVSCRIR